MGASSGPTEKPSEPHFVAIVVSRNSIESIRESVWASTCSAETYAAALHSVAVAPRVITRTKQDVCRVLSQNKIAYSEEADGVLCLFSGALRILPPYSGQCFRSTNEMVLARVQSLFEPT